MNRTERMKRSLVPLLVVAGLFAMAAPAAAFDPASPEEFAPVGDEAQRVAEDPPAAPVFEPNEQLPPPEDDFVTETTFGPVTTSPPKVDAAQFGVGWPAAVAVGVALLAVLAMALMWRRDEVV
ncbi:MAG: hypothetical protein HKN91_04670 [Acidimicrobiia bacterium]|nr:hypothetical protein [Acidimicrobiia bacterium]